jgi:hypothetical protein
MHSLAGRALAAIGVIATMLVPAAPAAADDVVATLAHDTPIAAFDGIVAWSDHDAATGRYRLVLRQGNVSAPAPIASAARPFDVSLGPNARGRVVALYTRCRSAAHGCDVYSYALAARRERKLTALSSRSRDEAWPVQWGDRVAFVRRARVYGVNGKRDIDELRPDPRGKRGGGTLVECDEPFVKTLSSRAPARPLDRGFCANTTGMAIRATTIVQLTSFYLDFNAAETQVRRLDARGLRASVLARGTSGLDGYSSFASPSLSRSAVWLTRIGDRDPQDFLRIDLRTRKLTAVAPNLLLAGAVARDERGTFWYVQRPEPLDEDSGAAHGSPPFCGESVQPCRLVRASASPFSRRERTLPPQLQLARSSFFEALYPVPVAVFGQLTAAVVRGARVIRQVPLAGARIELASPRVAAGAPVANGLATTTDATGRWSFTLSQGPPSAQYVAFDRTLQLASGIIDLTTLAQVTLTATPTTLAGAVTPAQPGRNVAIQRLETGAAGRPLGCDPFATGAKACTEDNWATVATVALDATGAEFSAAVGGPGYYRIDLQPDPRSGAGYFGRSPVIQVS